MAPITFFQSLVGKQTCPHLKLIYSYSWLRLLIFRQILIGMHMCVCSCGPPPILGKSKRDDDSPVDCGLPLPHYSPAVSLYQAVLIAVLGLVLADNLAEPRLDSKGVSLGLGFCGQCDHLMPFVVISFYG